MPKFVSGLSTDFVIVQLPPHADPIQHAYVLETRSTFSLHGCVYDGVGRRVCLYRPC